MQRTAPHLHEMEDTMGNKGTFDQLNDALFAQLEKLQSVDYADSEQMRQAIAQTNAVSGIAANIINNNATKISAMRYFESIGVEYGNLSANAPNMLGSGE